MRRSFRYRMAWYLLIGIALLGWTLLLLLAGERKRRMMELEAVQRQRDLARRRKPHDDIPVVG